MVMAGAAGAAFRRATRVGELPPFAPRMELQRPEQASGTLRNPLPSVEAPAWHPPSAGTTRAAEVAPPMIRVEQLAGQVLKEIDRRVTARRERLGQR